MSRKTNRLKSLRKKAAAVRKKLGCVSESGMRQIETTVKELGNARLDIVELKRKIAHLAKLVDAPKCPSCGSAARHDGDTVYCSNPNCTAN